MAPYRQAKGVWKFLYVPDVDDWTFTVDMMFPLFRMWVALSFCELPQGLNQQFKNVTVNQLTTMSSRRVSASLTDPHA